MKYKLIKEYPNRNIGDTIYMRLNGGEETYYWSKDNELLSKDFFPESKWFAPMLFTTEDKVDIYLGDTYWIQLPNKCIVEVPTHMNKVNQEIKVFHNTYSTKQAAEDYLKPKYPKSWEDLKEVHGYALGEGRIWRDFEYCNNYASHKIFNTSKQAESALAYAQLSQLIAEINQNWQPNWSDEYQKKYRIVRFEEELATDEHSGVFHPLVFKSAEARDFSFEHHNSLWNKYYQL